MKINGKEYKISIDISFGALEDSQKNSEDPQSIKAMLKEVLVPAPTDAQIRKFKMSEIMEVMEEFTRLQEEKSIDFKKKRLR